MLATARSCGSRIGLCLAICLGVHARELRGQISQAAGSVAALVPLPQPNQFLAKRADGAPARGASVRAELVATRGDLDFPLVGASVTADGNGVADFTGLGFIGAERRLATVAIIAEGAAPVVRTMMLEALRVDSLNPGTGFGSPHRLANEYTRGRAADPLVITALAGPRHLPAPHQPITVSVQTEGSVDQLVRRVVTDDNGKATIENLSPAIGCAATCGAQTITFRSAKASYYVTANPAPGGDAASLAVSVPGGTLTIRAGEPLPPIVKATVKQGASPLGSEAVLLSTSDGDILAAQTTNTSGVVTLASSAPVRLASGDATLKVAIADTIADVKVHVVAGFAARAYNLQNPPEFVRTDTSFESAPSIRVTDAVGNPVVAKLRVRLCGFGRTPLHEVSLRADCPSVGRLDGTLNASTDTTGTATFSSLRLSGPAGAYRLDYVAIASTSTRTDTLLLSSEGFQYDPDRSFIAISAIKTIAGVAPKSEFSDLRFRFKYSEHWSTLINADINLTSTTNKDSIGSSQRVLTEALALVNVDACRVVDYVTIAASNLFATAPTHYSKSSGVHTNTCDQPFNRNSPQRRLFLGGEAKLFNSVPYYGLQTGSIELGGSPFQGSMFSVGVVRPVFFAVDTLDDGIITPARYNIALDVFIRSSQIEFFKLLNIRASIIAAFPKKAPASPAAGLGGALATRADSGVTTPPTTLSTFSRGMVARLTIAVPMVMHPF